MQVGLGAIGNTDRADRVADIVFVHGLEGNARTTWQLGGREDTFWPTWLAEDLPCVGVWSLAYEASASDWRGAAGPLIDQATGALSTLEAHGLTGRPLIFICHSLGGILVKQMLRNASGYGNPAWESLATSTRGIVFLATPHAGSHLAEWLRYLARVARTSLKIKELEANNAYLRDLNLWFRQYAQRTALALQVYFEMQASFGIQIVNAASADPGIQGVTPIPVDLDHSHICKPESRSSFIYPPVKRFVETLAPVSAPVPPPSPSNPTNLAADLTTFVGRERERADLTDVLTMGDARLVTLLGPGGMGKTRLSREVGLALRPAFPDGVFFISLAESTQPMLVPTAIVQALGVGEEAGSSPRERLIEHLRPRHLLLILDNLEQVVDAAPLVTDLLTACPRLRVLATSRVLLGVKGELLFPLSPLDMPEARESDPEVVAGRAAVVLFVDRARSVRPGFAVTSENAADVAEICRLLDGLPLTLELAAARIRMLSPAAMLTRLQSTSGGMLAVLSGGPRDLPDRQRTIRATIDWSFALLPPEEQSLFCRLSVFAGGWRLEDAEAICGEPPVEEVFVGLASLLDHSLLREEGKDRFTMLQVIRQFAREQLEAAGEAEMATAAHARVYLALARDGDEARLEEEHANLLAALQWALDGVRVDEALELGAALWRYWNRRGFLTEGNAYLERVLTISGGGEAARAEVERGAGVLAAAIGDYDRAESMFGSALTRWRDLGNDSGAAHALNHLGGVAHDRGNYESARALYEEALGIRRTLGDEVSIAGSLTNLGFLAHEQGEVHRASALYAEALPKLERTGDPSTLPMILSHMAEVAQEEGDLTRAAELAERALATCRAVDDRQGIAVVLGQVAGIAVLAGDHARAMRLFREALALHQDLGDRSNLIDTLERFASVTYATGRFEVTARLLGAIDALRESVGLSLHAMQRGTREAMVSALRGSLGDEEFVRRLGEGKELSLDTLLSFEGEAHSTAPSD